MAQPTLFPESGFRRLRIDIAYDGTAFFGWATQPDHRTIQDLVEQAIAQVSRGKVQSIVAGRTDAGVHATGQVIHVDLPDSVFSDGLNYGDLRYKLNRILDEDVRVMEISDAPEGFHARFSALRRIYTYKILDANEVIPPLSRYDVAPWYRPLDADLREDPVNNLVLSIEPAIFHSRGCGHETYFQHFVVVRCGAAPSLPGLSHESRHHGEHATWCRRGRPGQAARFHGLADDGKTRNLCRHGLLGDQRAKQQKPFPAAFVGHSRLQARRLPLADRAGLWPATGRNHHRGRHDRDQR